MYKKIFDLHEQVALIIGGAGGIASACASGLADFGANIVIADKNLAMAEEVAANIAQQGAKTIAIQVDITDFKQVETMTNKTLKEFGKIDIMLNSAAATVRKPLVDITPEEWNKVINVNLNSSYVLSKVIGQEMIKRRKGKVIQIASTGGLRASANFSAYGSSKAGLIHLVKTLALEWAPYQINVNAIAPTATKTNFTADYYAQHPEKMEKSIKSHPFGRLGEPRDYVGAAIYLASPASDFVNGQVIVVDSGRTV